MKTTEDLLPEIRIHLAVRPLEVQAVNQRTIMQLEAHLLTPPPLGMPEHTPGCRECMAFLFQLK